MKISNFKRLTLACTLVFSILIGNSSYGVGVLSLHPQDIPKCASYHYNKSKYYIFMPFLLALCVLGDEVKFAPNIVNGLKEQGFDDLQIQSIEKEITSGNLSEDTDVILRSLFSDSTEMDN